MCSGLRTSLLGQKALGGIKTFTTLTILVRVVTVWLGSKREHANVQNSNCDDSSRIRQGGNPQTVGGDRDTRRFRGRGACRRKNLRFFGRECGRFHRPWSRSSAGAFRPWSFRSCGALVLACAAALSPLREGVLRRNLSIFGSVGRLCPPNGAFSYTNFTGKRSAFDPYRICTPCGDFAASVRKICSQGLRFPDVAFPKRYLDHKCKSHLAVVCICDPTGKRGLPLSVTSLSSSTLVKLATPARGVTQQSHTSLRSSIPHGMCAGTFL